MAALMSHAQCLEEAVRIEASNDVDLRSADLSLKVLEGTPIHVVNHVSSFIV
jgi:hypothetical protein